MSLQLKFPLSFRSFSSNFPCSPYSSWEPSSQVCASFHTLIPWMGFFTSPKGCPLPTCFQLLQNSPVPYTSSSAALKPKGVETDEKYKCTSQAHILLLVPFWPGMDARVLAPEHSRLISTSLLLPHMCVAFAKRK